MVAYIHVYFTILILPFNDWTCSAAHAGEECEATTEMTLSLQVDLVLNDAAATNDP